MYTDAMYGSRKRAVERVAGVLYEVLDSLGLSSASEVTPNGRLNGWKEKLLGKIFGEPGRTRTYNPLIKSQLLYH